MNLFNLLSVVIAIVSVNEYIQGTEAYRVINYEEFQIINALSDEEVSLVCDTEGKDEPSCTFIKPSGEPILSPDLIGKCFLKIMATMEYSGTWYCNYMGKLQGEEGTNIIHLRIVGEFAATLPSITTPLGFPTTLQCATTKGHLPINDCNFEPPSDEPFGIDETATISKPLLNRYYFPSESSLESGECAVTISDVKLSDFGVWKCRATLSQDGKEYSDIISVHRRTNSFWVDVVSGSLFGIITIAGTFMLMMLARRYVFGYRRPVWAPDTRRRSRRRIPRIQIIPPSESETSSITQ